METVYLKATFSLMNSLPLFGLRHFMKGRVKSVRRRRRKGEAVMEKSGSVVFSVVYIMAAITFRERHREMNSNESRFVSKKTGDLQWGEKQANWFSEDYFYRIWMFSFKMVVVPKIRSLKIKFLCDFKNINDIISRVLWKKKHYFLLKKSGINNYFRGMNHVGHVTKFFPIFRNNWRPYKKRYWFAILGN